ncbi:MAG: YidC/Oxa1 family membrane protein insertase [Atopobiaceae bacterium]|jgi:YidC/Oxa1 family membrane protein insertase|nr:YidC/Oxa1 family membrane protein insertase [Atopobiaceae bacterium]MCI2173662.1 YidC/Oxa1 family membrane protein insertase [Atopobiaceae bacterium]MCI2207696.1 YidC/Oxa1 family membrane protein insertase [Atopobiaceae bacterium]
MWDWFINFLTDILAGLAGFVGDWGLAIILLTFIIRLLLTPLTMKSTKSSAKMQALQPRMMEIQERYADDPTRQSEELRKFYSENKFNPLGGCLPMFLQMPVFFALFTVLQKVPAEAHFYGILDSLSQSVSGAISANGWQGAIVYILLDVLFGVLTLIPMLLNTQNSAPEQASQTKIMGVVMAAMMMWFGWSVPVGVVLYYDTSAAWGVIQQVFITQRVMESIKAQEAERLKNQPVQVDVVRKERKQRPHKKD